MSHAASEQAHGGTADIGTPEQFKMIAGDGATQLQNLRIYVIDPVINDSKATADFRARSRALDNEAAIVSARLATIASSQTDQDFAAAVFAMCGDDAQSASVALGQFLTIFGNSIASANNLKMPEDVRAQQATYWRTFGARLTAVPGKCAQAKQAMAEASAEEQQAEANHQANVAAVTNTAAALLMGAAIFAGAVENAQATNAAQNQAAYQQWQTNMQLQSIDTDLRRQNYLLQQEQISSPSFPAPAPPIQPP